MKLGPFEIFLLAVAGVLVLFLILWAREETSRWWAGRHLRKEGKEAKRHSNSSFLKRTKP